MRHFFRKPSAGRAVALFALLAGSLAAQQPAHLHPAVDPAHTLTAKDFVRDIGADFAALFDRRSIIPLVVGAEAVSLSTIPEQALERHFAPGDMWGGWAAPGKYIGNPIVLAGIAAPLFIAGRKSSNRKFRSLSYSLVHGMIMTETIAQTSKALTNRLRPNGEDHKSFPSAHATDTFVFATILTDHYGWKAALPAFTAAAYVSSTRLVDRKHHLTDVAAGAAIGVLAGRTVTRRIHGDGPSHFTWQVYPSRKGVTGAIQIALP